jgi:hypothetical protein
MRSVGPRVKIRTEKSGACTATPDFGAFMEELRVSQQKTPTAIANSNARKMHDQSRSIVDVFSEPMIPETLGPCSFHPGLPSPGRDQGQI